MNAYAKSARVRATCKRKGDEFRAKLAAIKLASGCVDCGYRQHPHALDFDHLTNKTHNISAMATYRWERVLEEIAKCEVVCSNCHRVRSFERGDVGRPKVYA